MTNTLAVALPGLALGLVAGIALGLVAFGGLWWTVRRLAHRRRPHLALALSSVLRLALVALALAGLARLGLTPLGAAVVGLSGVRLVLTRRLGRVANGAASLGAGD